MEFISTSRRAKFGLKLLLSKFKLVSDLAIGMEGSFHIDSLFERACVLSSLILVVVFLVW